MIFGIFYGTTLDQGIVREPDAIEVFENTAHARAAFVSWRDGWRGGVVASRGVRVLGLLDAPNPAQGYSRWRVELGERGAVERAICPDGVAGFDPERHMPGMLGLFGAERQADGTWLVDDYPRVMLDVSADFDAEVGPAAASLPPLG